MSDRAAFEAAVRDAPDDDDARLVFADWLDDAGEHARAEFVRVQVGRERLPTGDIARLDALAREDELLASHESAWLPPMPSGASAVRWHRGFVDTIRLPTDRAVISASPLADSYPVVNLCVGRAARFLVWPALDRVRGLSFAAAGLIFIELAGLVARPDDLLSLRELDLSGNRGLAESAGEALAEAPWLGQIEALSLAGTALRTAGVVAVLRSGRLGALTALDLRVPWLGVEESRAVGELPHPERLTHLRLANARNAGPSTLFASGRLSGLAELHLDNCQLERPLTECPSLEGLRVLRLERVSAAFDLAADLAAFAGQCWPGLEVLELADARLTDRDVATLAACPGLSSLRALSVTGYELTGRSLDAVARSPFLRGLAVLRMGTWASWPNPEVLGAATFAQELRCADLGKVARPTRAAEALGDFPRLHWASFSNRGANPSAALLRRWRPFPGTWPGRGG